MEDGVGRDNMGFIMHAPNTCAYLPNQELKNAIKQIMPF